MSISDLFGFFITVKLHSGIGPMDFGEGLYAEYVYAARQALKDDVSRLGLDAQTNVSSSNHDVMVIQFQSKEDMLFYKLNGSIKLGNTVFCNEYIYDFIPN